MEESIYSFTENLFMVGTKDEIQNHILKHKVHIDDNLFEIITIRNDLDLFKFALKNGAQVDDHILGYCCYSGYLEHVKYMIEDCKMEFKNIFMTTSFSNNIIIKEYLSSLV